MLGVMPVCATAGTNTNKVDGTNSQQPTANVGSHLRRGCPRCGGISLLTRKKQIWCNMVPEALGLVRGGGLCKPKRDPCVPRASGDVHNLLDLPALKLPMLYFILA